MNLLPPFANETAMRGAPEFAIAVMKTMAHRLRREMHLDSP